MMKKQTFAALALGAACGLSASAVLHKPEIAAHRTALRGTTKESTMEPRFISAASAERFALVGLDISVRASARDTRGAATLLEQVVPRGAGSPLHTVREDKILTVVGGHVTVVLGSEERRLGPGDTAIIPRGAPHRFHNPEEEPARFLMLVLPGGHERYLSEAAGLQARGALSTEAMTELGQHYGVALL